MCSEALLMRIIRLQFRKMLFPYVLSGASRAENTTEIMKMLYSGCTIECREHKKHN